MNPIAKGRDLDALGVRYALTREFATAAPFPHLIVDDLFDQAVLDEVFAEFPDPSDARWKVYTGAEEAGKREGGRTLWGGVSRLLFDFLLHDPTWIRFLEDVAGIDRLVGSPIGGGYHCSVGGARLDSHVDFTRDPASGLFRRLNVLLFLNPSWRSEWGGVLELGTGEAKVEVLPTWNRLVVFQTSSRSWHGHPVPVAPGKVRRSAAVYYFTADAPEDFEGDHSTVWKGSDA